MHFSSFAAVAALVATVCAAPANVQRHVLHQKRAPSHNWIKRDRVHSELTLPMRIGLTQSNLDKGHELLMEVADPASPKYGKHYTAEQVHDIFAPASQAVDAVRNWLEAAGVEGHRITQSVNKQWMELDLSAAEAEALLQTKYHFFEHAQSGKTTIGCDEYASLFIIAIQSHALTSKRYHVHEDVTDHVDYITPGIKLLASRKPKKAELEKRTFGWGQQPTLPPLKAPMPESLTDLLLKPLEGLCDIAIIPGCIELMYNFTKATTAQKGNELGIFEDLGDYYAQEDLNLFFAFLQPRIPQGTHPILEGVDGGTAPAPVTSAGPESDLDFQISYPIIYPQNSILFQTDDPVYEANYTYNGFLNNFLDAIDGSYCTYSAFGETGNRQVIRRSFFGKMARVLIGSSKDDPPYPHNVPGGYNKPLQCGVYKPTNVISVSYGGQEADLDFNYQKRQCNEFMKLGMQGVSVLISSGDSGVAGPAGDDSDNGCLDGGKTFSPDFPASCPYITAVGATLLTGSASKDQETAVTRFGSGGGFSNIYAIPSYQKTAVNNYLSAHPPPYKSYATQAERSAGGVYNRTGRAYPDVSAVGDNIVIFNMGLPTLIGGTSASSPVFASILTRINDERLKAGKKPVGFVNPTLYANPQVLHDITQGNNPGCGTNGFAASTGWDPVTGLGTPNYPAMLKLFMAQP
ncbi:hypothetical protein AC578_2625 [Pseudocercospora eumusae]|uniref:tripeptidyl-peptidase II n=1 Tax=Pseudocercospora eumusae TaxID=321146 RepID=A0A139H7U3_9PEZI|nr:hypothetical protein AC578_2625 [Pseudocercospora eumusae]